MIGSPILSSKNIIAHNVYFYGGLGYQSASLSHVAQRN
jgi:hypothetical protein